MVIDLKGSGLPYAVMARQRFMRRPMPGLRLFEQHAALLGIDPAPLPVVWTGAAERARAQVLIPEDAPVVALCPTASWTPKMWPAERFAALFRHLAEGPLPGARAAIFGGPGPRERAGAAPLLAALAGRHRPRRRADPARRLGLFRALCAGGQQRFRPDASRRRHWHTRRWACAPTSSTRPAASRPPAGRRRGFFAPATTWRRSAWTRRRRDVRECWRWGRPRPNRDWTWIAFSSVRREREGYSTLGAREKRLRVSPRIRMTVLLASPTVH